MAPIQIFLGAGSCQPGGKSSIHSKETVTRVVVFGLTSRYIVALQPSTPFAEAPAPRKCDPAVDSHEAGAAARRKATPSLFGPRSTPPEGARSLTAPAVRSAQADAAGVPPDSAPPQGEVCRAAEGDVGTQLDLAAAVERATRGCAEDEEVAKAKFGGQSGERRCYGRGGFGV